MLILLCFSEVPIYYNHEHEKKHSRCCRSLRPLVFQVCWTPLAWAQPLDAVLAAGRPAGIVVPVVGTPPAAGKSAGTGMTAGRRPAAGKRAAAGTPTVAGRRLEADTQRAAGKRVVRRLPPAVGRHRRRTGRPATALVCGRADPVFPVACPPAFGFAAGLCTGRTLPG